MLKSKLFFSFFQLACGTQSDKVTLTNDSLCKHVRNGETVCLHAVCVDKDYRKKVWQASCVVLSSYHENQCHISTHGSYFSNYSEIIHRVHKIGASTYFRGSVPCISRHFLMPHHFYKLDRAYATQNLT